jgi:hypothetical protein
MSSIKRMTWKNTEKGLQIETPLGVVSIRVGLTDWEGRKVETIEIAPNNLAGQPKVVAEGGLFTSLTEALSTGEEE